MSLKQDSGSPVEKGPIAWMAGNSVAANLVMVVFLLGGLFMAFNIKQEVFPEFDLDIININVAYPGASPEEVENGIILAIEEAVQDLEGVDEIRANANEGRAVITVEAIEGTNINRLWQEIKSEIDRITTMPDEAEDPEVSIAVRKREVLRLALYGDIPETTMRALADQVRDEMLKDDGISQIELKGVRDREIHIEISGKTLRRYNLTLQDVARTISGASVELGGGSIKARGGDILLRVKDRKEWAEQYARLPLIASKDGSRVFLGDIASVLEGFEETDRWASFNGQRAVVFRIYRIGDQTPTQVAARGKVLAEQINVSLPEGVNMSVIRDLSQIFTQRADLLLRNAYLGLGLVFIFLAIFLEIRLAFWVALGIPISFLGSFLFLAPTSFSINMVSMFAFIVTLGIVVDDAVVVGENVYFYRRQGLSVMEAAIKGTKDIAMPVSFSVITNMVAFVPMLFVPGYMGKIFKSIPAVVIAVFFVSLIESLFILPAHLNHKNRRPLIFPLNHLENWQERFSRVFEKAVRIIYGRVLSLCLEFRYSLIAFGSFLLLLTAGYVTSGKMGMENFPIVESDYAFCEATLPYGAPAATLKQVEKHLVKRAEKLVSDHGGSKLSKGIYSLVDENRIRVYLLLTDPDVRPLSTKRVTRIWREMTGVVPGLENISYSANRGGPGSGKNLTISLSHRDKNMLDRAGEILGQKLSEYEMVQDIDDGSAKGKKQFDISLSAEGKRMGLTSREVANQVRHSFQGVLALKSQRGRNEVTVRIRLPESERKQESTFEELVLLAPEGEILLRNAVDTIISRAYTSISRTDGRREIRVTANVRPASQADLVLSDMKKEILPDMVTRFPGLSYDFKGRQAATRESITSLMRGLGMALICVFGLLAIPFRSYVQPFIIMFCIPFGMIGAIAGHVIMGYSLSVISLFGLVAMTGVVINDSLVLIDCANRKYRSGAELFAAVQAAGLQRFRPILLTTLTTCGGLAPIITETSRQAKFLIPMAISLGFGILFATFITLIMVPCLYIIIEDIKGLFIGKAQAPDNN